MAVKPVYSKGRNDPKRSPGPAWKWDSKKQQWWSHGFDITLADGTRHRESGFFTKQDAETAVMRIRLTEKEKRHGFVPEHAKPTLRALIDKRLASITDHRENVRTMRVLSDFAELLPDKIKIDALNSAHFELYTQRRLREGIKPQSVNREFNIIAATLNKARIYFPVLSQWIPPKIDRPKARRSRRERLIATEEKQRLLAYLLAPRQSEELWWEADARLRVGHVCKFGLLTGARHGEIDRIRWEHVDFAARVIQIVGVKTEKKVEANVRYLRISDAMLEILQFRRSVSEDPYVFSKSGNTNPNFYRILRKACEKLDIPYGRDVENGLVFHDSRHTVVTTLLQGGVDLSTIGSITGHTDKSLILYYGHATESSRSQAADVLDSSLAAVIENPPAQLNPAQVEALGKAFEGGKISLEELVAILRGERPVPEGIGHEKSAAEQEP